MNLIRSKTASKVLAISALTVASLASPGALAASDRLCADDSNSNCYLVGDFPADVVQAAHIEDTSAGPMTIRFINGDWYISDYFLGNFGAAGWTPVIGDWDGDGFDNIGVYNNGTWIFKNSWDFDSGYDVTIHRSFGDNKWTPIVGDWNNDGHDTLGIYAGGAFKIRMISGDPSTDRIIDFGELGSPVDGIPLSAHPIAGAFDNGPDRVGITYDGYAFYSMSNEAGTRSISYPVPPTVYIGFLPATLTNEGQRYPIVIDADNPNALSEKASVAFSTKPENGYLEPTSPHLMGLWVLTAFKNLEGNPVNGDQTFDPFPEPF